MSGTVHTIGYGGRNPDEFLALLNGHAVTLVVDVRLRPDKASMGSYVKAKDPSKGIEGLLAKKGIRYVSLIELGNPFVGLPDWESRYRRLLDAARDVLLERLRALAPPYCLLCAEKRVAECHRLTIADFLVRTRGWAVEHIE